MKAILAITVKDLRLLLRDRTGFFVTFVFPIVYAIFFGVIFGARGLGAKALTVAVIDDARNEASAQYVNALRRSERLNVRLVDELTGESCMADGTCAALVRIPKAFESPSNDDVSRATVTARFSPALSPKLAADVLDATVNLSPGEKNALVAAAMSRETESSDTRASVPQAHAYELSFPIGIAWGVLGCTASFGLSLVIERTRGTLFRLRTAPVGQMHIVAGKAGACFVSTLALGTVLIAIGRLAFDVHPFSYSLLALALVSISMAFAGIMVLLSVIGKTERAASGIIWTILLAMIMLGGGMVPHFFMPGWLQSFAVVSPVRWAILVMEGAIWRDYHFAQMISPCATLAGIGALCLAAGGVTFRWTQRD